MKRCFVIVLALAVTTGLACGEPAPTPPAPWLAVMSTASPTDTPTPTQTPTPTRSPGPTSTPTPTATLTSTPEPAPTPVPPQASFSADRESGRAPLTVYFGNTSEGPIASVRWDFGDGTTSTSLSPRHRYTVAGSYTVQLAVSGPGGAAAVAESDLIAVRPGPPVSLEIVPPSATLAVLERAQFEAVLRDKFGNVVPGTPYWSVIAGGGSIDPSGIFTAGNVMGGFADTAMAYLLTNTRLIAAAASVTVTASSLIARWSFDEGSGSTAGDSSGNGNSGTLLNSPAWVNGRLGKALFFDSSSSEAVSVADAPELRLGFGSFSIVFWVKYSNVSDADLLRKGSTQTASDWYKVEIPDTGGRVSFNLNTSSNTSTTIKSAPHGDNQWHHIAAVRDVENGRLRLYVDGVQEAMTSDPGGSVSNSAKLAIGSKDTLDDDFFDGWLDDVAIYDEALSQATILALFNTTNNGAP